MFEHHVPKHAPRKAFCPRPGDLPQDEGQNDEIDLIVLLTPPPTRRGPVWQKLRYFLTRRPVFEPRLQKFCPP